MPERFFSTLNRTFLAIAVTPLLGLLGLLVPVPTTSISITPAYQQMQIATEATVQIRVDDVQYLYGAEVHLLFNPDVLSVVDANPATPAIEIAPGTIFTGFQPYLNVVNNSAGEIHFGILSGQPLGYTGSGVLATIRFRSKYWGSAVVTVVESILTNSAAVAIPHLRNAGTLEVSGPTLTPPPTEPPTLTSTPTRTPTRTASPTLTPSLTPSATSTGISSATASPTLFATLTPSSTATEGPSPTTGPSLTPTASHTPGVVFPSPTLTLPPYPGWPTPTPTETSPSKLTPTSTATSSNTPSSTSTATGTITMTPTGTRTASITPTHTPTHTRTPVPGGTSTPVGCQDLIINGGFESEGSWTLNHAGRSSSSARNGDWSMRVGIENYWENTSENAYSSAIQIVPIPAGVSSAVLRFWYYASSGDMGTRDWQYVFVKDATLPNVQANYFYALSFRNPTSNTREWTPVQIDVSRFAGKNVQVWIGCYNDGPLGGAYATTRLYVDDIALQVCTGPTPVPPEPTATFTPGPVSNTATPTATTAPSATPTRTPNPTLPPSQCEEKLINGGFEITSGWNIPKTAWSAGYSTTRVHSGSRALRLGLEWGDPNTYSYSSANQRITLPANASSATLRFWYYPASGDAYDGQYCWILNDYGQVIGEPLRLRYPNSDGRSWLPNTFDLTPYLGQTIRIHFEVYNNGTGGITTLYIDGASVEICP